jgi:predicted negative regulator of RcsB-dependent stress response
VAHIRRQELKKDEFVDSFEETLLWIEDHARGLAIAAVVIVVAGGSGGGFYWYTKKQEAKGAAALTEAMNTYQARVQAGLPPLPGQGAETTFGSEKEKYEAAEKEFAAVSKNYPRTQAAQLAQQYEALCEFELGQSDAAIARLQELARSGDKNTSAVAKFTLAGFYRKLGKRDDAAKLLNELADNPTPTVPRATALLELATLKADDDPAEARRLYTEIKNEYPDSPVATEVTRRLALLPAAPAQPSPPPAEPPGGEP